MFNAEFNDRGLYPVHLKLFEVNNPLLVLKDFFTYDWLPGHLERLKAWRTYILADDYYKGTKNSPAELLYFYKLNIRLVEAMHVYKQKGLPPEALSTVPRLEQEKNTWRDFPANLSQIEMLNPMLVIQDFFLKCDLLQYNSILYEWLEYGLSAKASNEFIETGDLITVYEHLQKLYSAAWLILQRLSEKPYFKAETGQFILKPENISVSDVSLYPLNLIIPFDGEARIAKLITIIKHKVSSVQAVIYLGAEPVYGTIFLLVLTANEEQRQAQALCSTIEESCRSVAKVVALVHHASSMFNGVEKQNQFFINALKCPILFLSGDLILSVQKYIASNITSQVQTALWERWHSQGKAFLSGAEYYMNAEAYGAALFSLQQSVECLLIAIIRVVLCYRINNHNLSKLLNITQMFTGDLAAVFNLDNPESAELFDLLKHAYVYVRYKDLFEADATSVNILYQATSRFLIITEKIYTMYLLTNSL